MDGHVNACGDESGISEGFGAENRAKQAPTHLHRATLSPSKYHQAQKPSRRSVARASSRHQRAAREPGTSATKGQRAHRDLNVLAQLLLQANSLCDTCETFTLGQPLSSDEVPLAQLLAIGQLDALRFVVVWDSPEMPPPTMATRICGRLIVVVWERLEERKKGRKAGRADPSLLRAEMRARRFRMLRWGGG